MTAIKTVDPNSFFADGISNINENFQTLKTIAETSRGTDNNSGLMAPILMAMGANNQEWLLPVAAPDQGMVVFDHGLILRGDQYTLADRKITLGYVPAEPYALSVSWSNAKAGITPPVSLTMDAQGSRYWLLPGHMGSNPLIFDTGRLLKRSEYQREGNLIELKYTPAMPYDISAAWGFGGPGMTVPQLVPLVDPEGLDTRSFQLPVDVGTTVLVTDHGVVLDAADYTLDFVNRTLTLNYTPQEPLDVAVSWGYPMEGIFIEESVPVPLPNGVIAAFTLPQEPLTDTAQVWGRKSDGTIEFYTRHQDFTVVGRQITFKPGKIPAAGTTLKASMMAVVLSEIVAESINGIQAVPATEPGVGTATQGGKLVATGSDGKLPPSVLPNTTTTINGFGAMSSTDARVGTSAAANYLAALGLDGRLDNDALPANPILGVDNNSVIFEQSVTLEMDTLTETPSYNADGSLAAVTMTNSSNGVVRTITYTYRPADGKLSTKVDTAGNKTVTHTYNYDANGNLTSISKSVV